MSGRFGSPPCGFARIRLVSGGLAMLLAVGGCASAVPVRTDVVDVHVVAQNRGWRASYLVADSERGSIDVPTGREVHVPLGAGVHLTLASDEYVSIFTVPDLDLRRFAAPRRPSTLTFFADRVGRYEVRGEEMCGLPHTDRARGWLVVEPADAFQAWMRRQLRGAHS